MDSFSNTMEELESDPRVLILQQFSQHQGNTTYQHCRNVALTSYKLAKTLNLKIDGKALATGAMLHDYYLYNTTEMESSNYEHGVNHPQIALENAQKYFELSEREKNIITSHMWPLTITAVPKGKEAVLVVITDKYCALREMIGGLLNRSQNFA